MKSEEKLDQCYEAVKDQLPFVPKLALILGSGLGDYAEHVIVEKTIPYVVNINKKQGEIVWY